MVRWPLLLWCGFALGCGDNFNPNEGGAGGTSGQGGSGGATPADPIGCADGTREYLANPNQHPRIAGCQGAWREPGVTSSAAQAPQCDRKAGNHGAYPQGQSLDGSERCSISDLCAAGWHVCQNALEVDALLESCPAAAAAELWIARQTTDQNAECTPLGGGNNIVGCGGLGNPAPSSCAPLDRMLIHTQCDGIVWICADSSAEGAVVVKVDSSKGGGVLCCAD